LHEGFMPTVIGEVATRSLPLFGQGKTASCLLFNNSDLVRSLEQDLLGTGLRFSAHNPAHRRCFVYSITSQELGFLNCSRPVAVLGRAYLDLLWQQGCPLAHEPGPSTASVLGSICVSKATTVENMLHTCRTSSYPSSLA
jgi:hypothetical protein